jgi:hypothetical protein
MLALHLGLAVILVAQFTGWPMGLKVVFGILIWTFNVSVFLADRNLEAVLLVAGGLLNTAAVVANGGYMPALGRTYTESWWSPLTEQSRLPALCDIYWGFSLGDFVIVSQLPVFLIRWWCR